MNCGCSSSISRWPATIVRCGWWRVRLVVVRRQKEGREEMGWDGMGWDARRGPGRRQPTDPTPRFISPVPRTRRQPLLGGPQSMDLAQRFSPPLSSSPCRLPRSYRDTTQPPLSPIAPLPLALSLGLQTRTPPIAARLGPKPPGPTDIAEPTPEAHPHWLACRCLPRSPAQRPRMRDHAFLIRLPALGPAPRCTESRCQHEQQRLASKRPQSLIVMGRDQTRFEGLPSHLRISKPCPFWTQTSWRLMKGVA
jgi:hypothetical protein